MRILTLTITAAVLGLAAGGVNTLWELAQVQENFDAHETGYAARPVDATQLPTPVTGAKVEVTNGEIFDFGEMVQFASRSHLFKFHNVGTGVLKLESGGTSCAACTISSIAKRELKPGETTEVAVEWKTQATEGEFRKEAYIRTTDPDRPTVRLTVHGNVLQAVVVEPKELTLGRVSQSTAISRAIRIFSFQSVDFQITKAVFSNTAIAEFFQVKIEPLDAEQLAQKTGAQQGYSLTVTVEPGLPLGGIPQTIQLTTNLTDLPKLEIPIQGTVTGDISIVGARFREQDNLVNLGVFPRSKGERVTLQLVVKGAHRKDIELAVGSIDPQDGLTATIGAGKAINDGAVYTYPLTIEVPPNSAGESRLGGKEVGDFGQVILRTSHPSMKEIVLRVRYAIEE